MTTQEQKRTCRKNRQNHKIKMSKAKESGLGIVGERPTVNVVRIKHRSHILPFERNRKFSRQGSASSIISGIKNKLRSSTSRMARTLR